MFHRNALQVFPLILEKTKKIMITTIIQHKLLINAKKKRKNVIMNETRKLYKLIIYIESLRNQ